jgi:hypothetical protein
MRIQTHLTHLATGSKTALLCRPAYRMGMHSLLFAASLIISGCVTIGAHKLPVDRFDYSAAIASSTNEQKEER